MVILFLVVLVSIVLLANVGLKERWARVSAYLLILAINGSIFLFGVWAFVSVSLALPEMGVLVDPAFEAAFRSAARAIGGVSLATALLASVLLVRPVRGVLMTALQRLRLGDPDPDSAVHTVAMVFSIYLLAGMAVQWLLAGGVSGLVELGGNVLLPDVLLSGVLTVTFAVLGVGLGVRRNWRETLERLGVERFEPASVLAGTLGAGVLLAFMMAMSGVWYALAPQSFEELGNATTALFGELTSLPSAFVVAVSTAVGEELLFRGALQPRFGLLPTTLLFTLLHVQYTLSPAWLLIFGVGLGLGLLRMWRGTTASTVAHFVYNFALLALASVGPT